MAETDQQDPDFVAAAASPESAFTLPLNTRLALEIPKPKDWQAFQRNCVLLFRAELNDSHAQEYGRSGQKQRGIDILACRDGRPDHYVGVQCRLITVPLKRETILADAREALEVRAGLKELIFATTAPNDVGAADAAVEVTRILAAEGRDLRVVVYGWDQLQTIIAMHEVGYNAFHPSAVATSAPQIFTASLATPEIAAIIAAQVVEKLQGGLTPPPREAVGPADEDPALHARIDTFRDLFREGAPLRAEKKLLELVGQADPATKPWAAYRLETNLGSIAMSLGRHAEAATRFEAAHATRPEDSNAIASLALARTIQGRYPEAMALARTALEAAPRAEHAIGYLLQAAARSDWEGDPESLIPPDLTGTVQADIGLAEFLRRRDLPGWAERTLDLARRHADTPEFKTLRAVAVLSLAVDSREVIPGGFGPMTSAELSNAADDLKALVEHYLDVGFADASDLVAHVNNAAVLLRLCERYTECEALLTRAMPRLEDEPQLRRLLALVRMAQDRTAEAVAALDGDPDPENRLLRAELQAARSDFAGAVNSALAVPDAGLTPRLRQLKWYVVGHAAVRTDDASRLREAVSALRTINPNDVTATLLEINGERRTVADEAAAQERLRALTASVPSDLDMTSRYFLATQLRDHDLTEEASRLLEDHVDLDRPSPAVTLYLQSLAAARRDAAFRSALAKAGEAVRSDATILWTVAAHAWNLGDLTAAMTAVEALLMYDASQARARLLKVEILIRQDRSTELFAELQQPLEQLTFDRPDDQFRMATLLGHFGFVERAADFAYRLFLQHRDLSRAWMTLSMLVLEEGLGRRDLPRTWSSAEAELHAAVDLTYDDGTEVFFVIEPDAALRQLDSESWEPDHPVAKAALGLGAGARFTGLDGCAGTVMRVRHKYVARLHYVMQNHHVRFPTVFGFQRVAVDFEGPGGLDALIDQVKARRDWIDQAQREYVNGPMPLSLLAYRLGMDPIQVSGGLASHGVKLKVAGGDLAEREAAVSAIRLNAAQGCVLDLLAFWAAWRIKALDAVRETCGPITLPQSVLDQLRSHRAELDMHAHTGLHTTGYEGGQLTLTEVPSEAVVAQRDDVDEAIAWAEANATVLPVVAGETVPAVFREQLRQGRTELFDALLLAHATGWLLVSDDLPTRAFGGTALGQSSAWLHAVFNEALARGHMDEACFIRCTANLIEAGHSYIGVTGAMLAQAARLDAAAGAAPGYLVRSLAQMIGGAIADPPSHVGAVIGCLQALWLDPAAQNFREPISGHLLRRLVQGRPHDCGVILNSILYLSRAQTRLYAYIQAWITGHFLRGTLARAPAVAQLPHSQQPARRRRRSRARDRHLTAGGRTP